MLSLGPYRLPLTLLIVALPVMRLFSSSLLLWPSLIPSVFFFLNDTAPPEISPLPLHDALPILAVSPPATGRERWGGCPAMADHGFCVRCPADSAREWQATRLRVGLTSTTAMGDGKHRVIDRKSTRLNSSH